MKMFKRHMKYSTIIPAATISPTAFAQSPAGTSIGGAIDAMGADATTVVIAAVTLFAIVVLGFIALQIMKRV